MIANERERTLLSFGDVFWIRCTASDAHVLWKSLSMLVQLLKSNEREYDCAGRWSLCFDAFFLILFSMRRNIVFKLIIWSVERHSFRRHAHWNQLHLLVFCRFCRVWYVRIALCAVSNVHCSAFNCIRVDANKYIFCAVACCRRPCLCCSFVNSACHVHPRSPSSLSLSSPFFCCRWCFCWSVRRIRRRRANALPSQSKWMSYLI